MFKDKTAIVSGASRGIGRAIALALGDRGCHVAFTYHNREDEAAGLTSQLESRGVRAFSAQVDASDSGAVTAAVKKFRTAFDDKVDFLVNNAGIRSDRALFMMDEETWDRVVDVNLKGVYNFTRSVIVSMMKRKSGVVLNIASISGLMGTEGQTNYAASKAGAIAFAKSLAREVGKLGLRVNSLALGLVETDMTATLPELARQRLLAMTPMNRMATVDEAAAAALFLLSDDAAYITGQVLTVDGGLY
jgi:3-oxoacyl-[acyl-carrier protein] reductase